MTAVERPGRVKGRAKLAYQFSSLQHNGARYEIRTEAIAHQGEATKSEDATKIGVGAGAGAVIGGLLGGGDGAAKGAAIGGDNEAIIDLPKWNDTELRLSDQHRLGRLARSRHSCRGRKAARRQYPSNDSARRCRKNLRRSSTC